MMSFSLLVEIQQSNKLLQLNTMQKSYNNHKPVSITIGKLTKSINLQITFLPAAGVHTK